VATDEVLCPSTPTPWARSIAALRDDTPELAVARQGQGLHRVRRQEQALGDLPEREVGGRQRQDPQLGGGERRAADAPPSHHLDLGSQRPGLAWQHAKVGSPLEDVIHLPEDSPSTAWVVKGHIGAGQRSNKDCTPSDGVAVRLRSEIEQYVRAGYLAGLPDGARGAAARRVASMVTQGRAGGSPIIATSTAPLHPAS
jgi:hypothetical protein